MKPDTLCAHPPKMTPCSEPLAPPIYESSVYAFPSLGAMDLAFEDEASPVYSRMSNPNALSLGAQIAVLEGAEAGAVVASGQGAILAALLTGVDDGGTLHYSPNLYGGTLALIRNWIARIHSVKPFDTWNEVPSVEKGDALFVESLSNPLIRPTPIGRLAEAARVRGARLIVDNTFATPAACRPISRGAQLVVHSLTKALSGHGHVILGAVVGDRETIRRIRKVASELGLAADPHAAWLAQEGSRTFGVRMAKAQANAIALAKRLQAHPAVVSVHHPSLSGGDDFANDFIGPGAMIAFDLGDQDRAAAFLAHLELIALAPSLGDVATTVSHPERSSHRGLDDEEKAHLRIGGGLIRLSVGIEDEADLWEDLAAALGGVPR